MNIEKKGNDACESEFLYWLVMNIEKKGNDACESEFFYWLVLNIEKKGNNACKCKCLLFIAQGPCVKIVKNDFVAI